MESPHRFREHRLDIILLDIQLPDVSSLHVTRQLNADEDLRDISIKTLKALAVCGEEECVLKAGYNDYIYSSRLS